MKLKGETTIELFEADSNYTIPAKDKDGNPIPPVVKENSITNYVVDLFQKDKITGVQPLLAYLSNYNNKPYGEILRNIFGGLLVFDKQLPSTVTPDNYDLPGGTNIIATGISHTGQQVQGNVAQIKDPTVWTDRTIESATNEFVLQWDFNQEQCNGTINAVCLCPERLAWEGEYKSNASQPAINNLNTTFRREAAGWHHGDDGSSIYMQNTAPYFYANYDPSAAIEQYYQNGTYFTWYLRLDENKGTIDCLHGNFDGRDTNSLATTHSNSFCNSFEYLITKNPTTQKYEITYYTMRLRNSYIDLLSFPSYTQQNNCTYFINDTQAITLDSQSQSYLDGLTYIPSVNFSQSQTDNYALFITICGGHSENFFSKTNEEFLILKVQYNTDTHTYETISTIYTNNLTGKDGSNLYIGNYNYWPGQSTYEYSNNKRQQQNNSNILITKDYILFTAISEKAKNFFQEYPRENKIYTQEELDVYWCSYERNSDPSLSFDTNVHMFTYLDNTPLNFYLSPALINNCNPLIANFVRMGYYDDKSVNSMVKIHNNNLVEIAYKDGADRRLDLADSTPAVIPEGVVIILDPISNTVSMKNCNIEYLFQDSNDCLTILPYKTPHLLRGTGAGSWYWYDVDYRVLSTINNLAAPVVKDESQTMRITYKLKFVDE